MNSKGNNGIGDFSVFHKKLVFDVFQEEKSDSFVELGI
jgi:hypothetical protein